MTVRGFETADGRIVEHGQLGEFPEVGDIEAERQLAGVLVDAAGERLLGGAQEATWVPYTAIGTTGGDALYVGDLFDVRLDELGAVHEATLPVAFER
jgi:hypothetical protein